MKEKIEIMGIPFLNQPRSELLASYVYPALTSHTKRFVVTANPEIVMLTKEMESYREAVLAADYVIPDGTGIILASKIIGTPLPERIPGFELMTDLIAYADEQGLSCYFLGASKTVNNRVVDKLKEMYPHLRIAGHHHGFFDLDDHEVVEQVVKAKPDLIFVALGAPRQEEWIYRHYQLFDKGVFMGVGGSFDVIAGNVKRAPDIWIKLNLEWLYRLLAQPKRFKRTLKVFEFIIRIIFKRY